MPVLEVSPADQYLVASGDTALLEIWQALPTGLYPPFPPVELPGGLNGLLQRGGFGQTFFLASEVLGLTFKSPKGQTVQAGGKVVKNVQGYDLVRPFVGSFGALGEVLQATLRLRPGRASIFLRRTGELSEVRQQPRFLWKELEYLYAFHLGHPREVERLRESFGGEAVQKTLDYTPLFPKGMGVGSLGSLRDLRFGWENAGPAPAVPEVFRRLAESL
jgi:FAD/FMN-containing dehydrogenase